MAHRHAARVRRLVAQLQPVLEKGGVACSLDLEPSLGVMLAAELRVRRLAHPVLVLPRWPYLEAVLPGNELLHSLLRGARRLTPESERSSNVVFVLDGERATLLPDRPPHDPRADNRHWLSSADLPNLATLRARGIRQVIKLAHGSA